MENVKVCAQCGAPFVGTRCPNCGGMAESGTETDTDGCSAGTSCCSNCGCIAGNGTSGRMVSAHTPKEALLDVPNCPWCGAKMVNVTRSAPEGWISYYLCKMCHAKAPTVVMTEAKEELVEAAKMVVNCRFLNTGNPVTNGDKIRRIGMMPDEELAPLLWKYMYDNLEDKIDFCKDLPECEAMVEHGGVPEEKCLQCLIQWLGAAAKKQEIATSAAPPRNDNEEGVCKD